MSPDCFTNGRSEAEHPIYFAKSVAAAFDLLKAYYLSFRLSVNSLEAISDLHAFYMHLLVATRYLLGITRLLQNPRNAASGSRGGSAPEIVTHSLHCLSNA